jgi:hypothetical protein
MFRLPVKVRKARLEPESTGNRKLRHVERSAHQRMIDLPFPQIGHSFTAICFVSYYCRRLFVLRPRDLAPPNSESVFSPTLRDGAPPTLARLAGKSKSGLPSR